METPNFEESSLHQDLPEIVYPVRELVGCLQWVCVVCRPDICCPANQLARVAPKKCARAVVNAAKKLLKYLIRTKNLGVFYDLANQLVAVSSNVY